MNSLLDNQVITQRVYTRPELQAPRKERNYSKAHSSKKNSFREKKQKVFIPAGNKARFCIDEIRQKPARIYHENYYRSGKKSSSSFSVPVVPLAALFLLALGTLFVVYSQGALNWIGLDVISAGKDQGSEYNMAVYAGLNPVETTQETQQLMDSSGEAIALDLMETFVWQSYKVQKGDTVSKIASQFSLSMDAIIASNGITNARSIREGEVLRIPNMDGIPYTVRSGDSLLKISEANGVPLEAILDANDIQSDIINLGDTLFIPGARMNREDLRMALGELFMYPLKGARLSSPFGWRDDPISGVRRHHAALDLSAPQGTVVRAAMEGKVSVVSYDRTYGNFIILSHSGGFQSMYAHLQSFSVKKGAQVSQGDQIGTVGNTGYSTGPHLHFAIFKNSRAVNPLDFLNPQR